MIKVGNHCSRGNMFYGRYPLEQMTSRVLSSKTQNYLGLNWICKLFFLCSDSKLPQSSKGKPQRNNIRLWNGGQCWGTVWERREKGSAEWINEWTWDRERWGERLCASRGKEAEDSCAVQPPSIWPTYPANGPLSSEVTGCAQCGSHSQEYQPAGN